MKAKLSEVIAMLQAARDAVGDPEVEYTGDISVNGAYVCVENVRFGEDAPEWEIEVDDGKAG